MNTRHSIRRSRHHAQRALTLIELVIVIVIVAITMSFAAVQSGTIAFWREEGFIRRLSETMLFLHHQAVVDQSFYRLEINLDRKTYQVGVMQSDPTNDTNLASLGSDAGTLSLELAAMLSPSVTDGQTMIPPPSFPSLADPVEFPAGLSIVDVRTMRGKVLPTESGRRSSKDRRDDDTGSTAYILFSPRGFSEFAVVHLEDSRGVPATILINPFTGLTEIYRVYKDFKWTYSKNKDVNE